jgi:hypothetical protein
MRVNKSHIHVRADLQRVSGRAQCDGGEVAGCSAPRGTAACRQWQSKRAHLEQVCEAHAKAHHLIAPLQSRKHGANRSSLSQYGVGHLIDLKL